MLNNKNTHSSKPSNQLIILCRWCAYISGFVCIFGIFFIIIFYIFYLSTGIGYGFGEMNDIAVIVQYALMFPITLLFYKILRSNGYKLSLFALLVGIIGILVVIFLQIILVIGLIGKFRAFRTPIPGDSGQRLFPLFHFPLI